MVLSFGTIGFVLTHVEDCPFDGNEGRLVWICTWVGMVSLRSASFDVLPEMLCRAVNIRTVAFCQLFICDRVVLWRVQVHGFLRLEGFLSRGTVFAGLGRNPGQFF